MAKFQKGMSGNIAGRKPGNATAARLREAIAESIPDIIETLTRLAKDGDVQASKLLMDRCLPPLKAQSEVVTINTVPDDTTATIGRLILDETMRGQLTPDITSQLLTALAAQVKIEEFTLLEQRISQLEGAK
ncbi:MAG: DUF5681 domain-containing protein [Methylobacter sp.]